ncbi:MAG TPA: hypothetical protein VNX68_12805 [Nitrosopumilaceae archaeon]|jgi:hypothetical protein|nr:hypothetical protein [Nitrosopumilaceae archaeon]
MQIKKLEAACKILESKWKKDLIDEIHHAGHEGTGKLEKSIVIKVREGKKGPQITIESDFYIQFLDKGVFLKKFLEKREKELEKIIKDSLSQDILDELTSF